MPRPLPPILTLITVATLFLAAHPAATQPVPAEPRLACDHAAATAEREWSVPPGLLAAIGTVESGRSDAGGLHRRAWPWSINADGWGYHAANKTEAISMVRALEARGARLIDVGCFQVDLFYHPNAFASLDEAFDPDANARVASRILSLGRFSATGWNGAVAAYHSASLLRGGWYLQQVLAAWPDARTRLAVLDMSPGDLAGYVVMLSPQARLVRIVTASDATPSDVPGLPRVIQPADVPALTSLAGATSNLPRVLTPSDAAPHPNKRL